MGRIICFDYGRKHIGIAITDELRMISSSYGVFENNKDFYIKISKLHQDYKFDLIIIGLPVSQRYKEMEDEVKAFGDKIKDILKLPVVFQDESFSTEYATSFLKSLNLNKKTIKKKIDKIAAQKILEDYLNSQNNSK